MKTLKILSLGIGLVLFMTAGTQAAETVYFRGWQYKTGIVQDNTDRFNKEQNGNVDYATVTGKYPSLMETKLIAGDRLDVIYANPATALRYYEGGWVEPINSFDNFDEIVADMYPNIRKAWTYKGKLLGLSYFVSTRGVMHVNMKKYGELGYSEKDFPKNWDGFYDQVEELYKKGDKTPFLPHWFNEYFGIGWGFIFEVINRGGNVAHPETHKVVMDPNRGPAFDTLTAWKRIWKAGIIPEDVLTMTESAYIEAFSSGRYVFSPQQAYDLKTVNDPAKSKIAGHVSLLPYQGQSWGLVDSAVYVMTKRKKRSKEATEEVKRFVSWYGHKDHNGKVFVGQRWMKESMLFSGYKPVMENPNTAKLIKDSLAYPRDYDNLLEVYKNTPYPDGVWKVVWSEVINSYLRERLSEFILEDHKISDVITDINKKIVELNDEYGI